MECKSKCYKYLHFIILKSVQTIIVSCLYIAHNLRFFYLFINYFVGFFLFKINTRSLTIKINISLFYIQEHYASQSIFVRKLFQKFFQNVLLLY